MKKRGKIIVLEGTDGSGKTTQSKRLIKNLKNKKIKVKFLDFPQYGQASCGPVEKYLNGKYGSAKAVGPYRASIFYAVDRYDVCFKIKKWLKNGYIVIANRYVASNLAHQGGKIANAKNRKKYYEWNENLEYNIFEIPRPDLNIILYVPAEISQKMVAKKGIRKYLGGKTFDIHEADINHLKETEKVYLELIKTRPKQYKMINCSINGLMMTRDQIAEMIFKEVKKII